VDHCTAGADIEEILQERNPAADSVNLDDTDAELGLIRLVLFSNTRGWRWRWRRWNRRSLRIKTRHDGDRTIEIIV
jgi:hypothetical protein